jgi:N-acetylneuraminic acid mutarotase
MRQDSLWPSALALSVFWLAACTGETTTEPTSTAQPPATVPELAVASNSWLTRANMPLNRTDLAVATVKNAAGQSVVYAIGGRDPNGYPNAKVTAYNVATNTWTYRHTLPTPLAGANGAGVINGKIYVSSGYTRRDDFPKRVLYMYDPATNTWTRKSDIPAAPPSEPYGENRYPNGGGVTGVINGKLYVVSGCFQADAPWGYFETCDPLFYRYNPATDRWVRLPSPFAEPTIEPSIGGVIAGKFYVMAASPYTRDAYFAVYDPATNKWTPRNAPAQSRGRAASAVLGGRLYLMGGTRYNASTDDFETLDVTVAYNPAWDGWVRRAPMPSPRTFIVGTTVLLNGAQRIEVLGGSAPGNNIQYVP